MKDNMDRTKLLKRLDELPYDRNEYWLAAGGAMVFYGFREETGDIDLGCTKKMADGLDAAGCPMKLLPDGTRKFSPAEDVEIFEEWIADRAEMHDGVPVVSVKGLIEMKRALGREKDLRDIRLIEEKMK